MSCEKELCLLCQIPLDVLINGATAGLCGDRATQETQAVGSIAQGRGPDAAWED